MTKKEKRVLSLFFSRPETHTKKRTKKRKKNCSISLFQFHTHGAPFGSPGAFVHLFKIRERACKHAAPERKREKRERERERAYHHHHPPFTCLALFFFFVCCPFTRLCLKNKTRVNKKTLFLKRERERERARQRLFPSCVNHRQTEKNKRDNNKKKGGRKRSAPSLFLSLSLQRRRSRLLDLERSRRPPPPPASRSLARSP